MLGTTALLALGVVTACGNGDNGSSAENAGEEEQTERLTGQFLTGSSGGVWDILGGGMAQILNDELDFLQVNPSNPTSIGAIPGELASGKAAMGFLQVDQVERALAGEEEFEEPMEGLTHLLPLYANVMIQFAHDGSDYEAVEDVSGATIATASDAQRTLLSRMYEIAGVDPDEIDWILLPYGEMASAFHDGDIDVATFTGYPFNAALEEVTITSDVQFIEASDDIIEEFNEAFPSNQTSTIPADTYEGQDGELEFYAVYASLTAHESMSDEHAYAIAEVLLNNQDRLAQAHPAGEEISVENLEWFFEVGLVDADDIHPGALQYFEDEGIAGL